MKKRHLCVSETSLPAFAGEWIVTALGRGLGAVPVTPANQQGSLDRGPRTSRSGTSSQWAEPPPSLMHPLGMSWAFRGCSPTGGAGLWGTPRFPPRCSHSGQGTLPRMSWFAELEVGGSVDSRGRCSLRVPHSCP